MEYFTPLSSKNGVRLYCIQVIGKLNQTYGCHTLWPVGKVTCQILDGVKKMVLHIGAINLDIHNGADETTIGSTVQALSQLC